MVKFKKDTRLFGLITCLFLAVSLLVLPTAHALYYQLNIQRYCQDPYDALCWATVSAMIISFYKGDAVDRKVEIAKKVHKSTTNFNKGGTILQMRDIIKEYISRKDTLIYDTISFLKIQQQIVKKCPLALALTFRKDGEGHAVCVRGFSSEEGNVVYIIDPADGAAKGLTYDYLVQNPKFSWDQTLYFTAK